jgi:DNA polymerase III epsilon subunit-like protein
MQYAFNAHDALEDCVALKTLLHHAQQMKKRETSLATY